MNLSTPEFDQHILFVHNKASQFVRIDLELLQGCGNVIEWYQQTKLVNILALASMVRKSHLIFGWFASWHSFFPLLFARVLKKPSILVIGGYDVADMSEIGYGHQRSGLKKWISRWVMRIATQLVAFSNASREEAARNAAIPKERISVIYLGVPDPIKELPTINKQKIALSVGEVNIINLARKGHTAFVKSAIQLPDVSFVLVGEWQDGSIRRLQSQASPNVLFAGWVEADVLNDYYRQASVYVQASKHEGFGLSVAEAMLAGCIPVVTRTGSLPEVVGDCGIYISSDDPVKIAYAIQ